ncbi:AAA family ATPase [Halosimplex halophilum]|uniref:AAA family ATPase n=1 Tax=Halosimplex halophilum TaxID=2559572 RepID=UPI00107F9075|nr:ATP-binding protein [Halosimplex halophilum]
MSTNGSDYDRWVAQGYRDDAEAAEAAAEDHLDADEPAAAAAEFERAADCLRAYEDYTGNSRSDEIDRLRRRAAAARPQSSDDGGAGSGGEAASGADSDRLRRRVESFETTTGVDWEDIGGLEETKERICHEIGLGAAAGLPEAVQPSDRLLLFGPPGTGKTLLASAVASGTETTFFNVELGGILSKWHGESSQLVSTLFDVAREHTPAVVFVDEIDALTQSRGDGSDSASRRVLNSLLTELDGIGGDADGFLMVVGSSNRPMDLDDAVVRRFDTRIYVPLPDVDGAAEIVRIHTVDGGVEFEGTPAAYAFGRTDPADSVEHTLAGACVERGFTGSDIETLCRTAISEMVRERNPELAERARDDLGARDDGSVDLRPLRPDDFRVAFDTVSASVPESTVRECRSWAEEFGSG